MSGKEALIGSRVRPYSATWLARFTSRFSTSVLPSHYLWLTLLALVTYGRVWQIQDVIWDDNAWLLSIYSTENLQDFLKIGFHDLRREPLGVALYYLFSFYRDAEIFFALWHGLELILSALIPVALYVFVNQLFKDRYLALFSGVALIAFPLDYVIGFASAINYKVSLLLMLASLALSVYTVRKAIHRHLLMIGALLTAGLSQYVFLEASLSLEPARLAMFAFLSGGALWYRRAHWLIAARKSIPFLLLLLPLAIYQLDISTSGVHAGLYKPDILHLIDLKQYAISLAHFLFFPWVVLGLNIDSLRVGTVFVAIMAAVMAMAMVILHGMLNKLSAEKEDVGDTVFEWTIPQISLLSLILIVPSFLLFQVVGRPISWGMDSTHATLCQIGYALLWGALFTRFWRMESLRRKAGWWAVAMPMAVFLGIGVFFSNLNIDLYYKSWQSQSRFFHEFLRRFPQLPRESFLVMDIRGGDLYSDIDLYDIEFPLNLLYARSTSRAEFYRHKIITAKDFNRFASTPAEAQRSGSVKIYRVSDHGTDLFDTDRLIFIHYRNGRLLVNREIAEQFPTINYRSWLDRKLPESDSTTSFFPLRPKLIFPPR